MQLFYQPADSSIKVGNKHINELSLHSWRGQIGYVTQENAMMVGTIRENLCYGLDSSVKENHIRLWEVIRLAHADELIKSFPKGLDTDVGEQAGMGTHEQLYKTHKLYQRFTEQQFNMQLD